IAHSHPTVPEQARDGVRPAVQLAVAEHASAVGSPGHQGISLGDGGGHALEQLRQLEGHQVRLLRPADTGRAGQALQSSRRTAGVSSTWAGVIRTRISVMRAPADDAITGFATMSATCAKCSRIAAIRTVTEATEI